MQKKFNLIRLWSFCGLFPAFFTLTNLETVQSQVIRKTEVTFKAEDGLVVSANKYFTKRDKPYIILLHTEGSSRAEFDAIAEKFLRMGYNCLAVDMRSGSRYGNTANETAFRAKKNGLATGLYESGKDINAAITYLQGISGKPIVLLGSSYSATLALMAGKHHSDINSVIAFSPGDFFQPVNNLKDILTGYPIPVFAAFSATEYPFYKNTLEAAGNNNITIFRPTKGTGNRTVEALFDSSENSQEYWFALMVFLRSLR